MLTASALLFASGFCPEASAAAQQRADKRRAEILRMFREAKPSPAPLVATEPAWSLTLSAIPSAAAAMDETRIYIPLRGDLLIALDRETGLLVWDRSVDTATPPTAGADLLFIASRGTIRALDATTGTDRWSVPIDGAVNVPLVWESGWLIALTDAGELLAFRASDGYLVWRRSIGSTSPHVPVLGGADTLYLSLADGRVIAVSLDTGTVRWERRLTGMLSEPAVAKDRVFVGSTDNFFHALDAESGDERWKWRNGGDVIGAAASDDVVYFASLDNMLRAVNRTNGNQRWRKPTGTRPLLPPKALDGIVVLPGLMPAITVFVGETGMVMGTQRVQGQLAGPPLIDLLLKPLHVAMVTVTREGLVEAWRPTALMFREGSVTPVASLPGRTLEREQLQETPNPKPQIPSGTTVQREL